MCRCRNGDVPDAGGSTGSLQLKAADIIVVGAEHDKVLSGHRELCFCSGTDIVKMSCDARCACVFQFDTERGGCLVVEGERLVGYVCIGIIGQAGKGECAQRVISHHHVKGGGAVSCRSKLHIKGYVTSCSVVESQLVGLLRIGGIVVCLKEGATCIDEGEGVFFMECMRIVSFLYVGRCGLRISLAECGRCSCCFCQEVVNVLRIRVVSVCVSACLIRTSPLCGAT